MLPVINYDEVEYHEFILPKSKNKVHIRKYLTNDVYQLLLKASEEKKI